MLKQLNNSCSKLLATAEKRLADEQARLAEEQRLMSKGRNAKTRSQQPDAPVKAQASQAAEHPFISLKLILEYGLALFNAKEQATLEQSHSPATLLLYWDFIAILSALVPQMTYNRFTGPNDRALFSMQRFYSDPLHFKQSLSRIEEQFRLGTTELDAPDHTDKNVTQELFDFAGDALQIGKQALTGLRTQIKGVDWTFFKSSPQSMVKTLSNQQQDSELAKGVVQIDRLARQIDPAGLDPKMRETMKTLVGVLDHKKTAQQILSM